MKRKSLKMSQQTKMTSQNMKMNRVMANRSWKSQMLTLISILAAKHCDLSDLLCILLRMHAFIIIFIALEHHTYVFVHT